MQKNLKSKKIKIDDLTSAFKVKGNQIYHINFLNINKIAIDIKNNDIEFLLSTYNMNLDNKNKFDINMLR